MSSSPRQRGRSTHASIDPYSTFIRSLDVHRTSDLVRHLLPNDYTSSAASSVEGFSDSDLDIEGRDVERTPTGRIKKRKSVIELEVDDESEADEAISAQIPSKQSQSRPTSTNYRIQLSTLWPLPPSDLPPVPSSSLITEVAPIATSLIRKRGLHFPPPRKPGMKQKYPRVPVDLEKVRREGIWVTGEDLGDGKRRWSKYPKKVRQRLMARMEASETAEAGEEDDEENAMEDGKEDDDDEEAEKEFQDANDGERDSSEIDDENQERFFKRRRVNFTLDTEGSSDHESTHADTTTTGGEIILPRDLAQNVIVWLNAVLLELALAMPEVTGKEFVDLHAVDWKTMVDTVAMKDHRDLKVAVAAEERLSKLYGPRPSAEDHKDVLISRQRSIHSSRLAALAIEAELCPDSLGEFKPLGPPIPIAIKERKPWTRKVHVDGNGTGEDTPPPKKKRGRPRKNLAVSSTTTTAVIGTVGI